MDFKQKVIVITGGSAGFGKVLAAAFKIQEAQVVIASNNFEILASTANELKVESCAVDVTSRRSILDLANWVLKKYGRLDVWVNNAGIQIAPSIVEEVEEGKLKRLMDVNFFGYFYGCQVVLPIMKKQGEGVIININSTAGLAGKAAISAYSASKFAIKGLTESLREELRGIDISVYGIFPGGMQTEIYKEKYPVDFEQYMSVEYAVDSVMSNFSQTQPELDLVIRRPSA